MLFDYLRVRDPKLYVFSVLAAVTGACRAQVLGLRWENVKPDTMRVSFRSGWVEGPDGPVFGSDEDETVPCGGSRPGNVRRCSASWGLVAQVSCFLMMGE